MQAPSQSSSWLTIDLPPPPHQTRQLHDFRYNLPALAHLPAGVPGGTTEARTASAGGVVVEVAAAMADVRNFHHWPRAARRVCHGADLVRCYREHEGRMKGISFSERSRRKGRRQLQPDEQRGKDPASPRRHLLVLLAFCATSQAHATPCSLRTSLPLRPGSPKHRTRPSQQPSHRPLGLWPLRHPRRCPLHGRWARTSRPSRRTRTCSSRRQPLPQLNPVPWVGRPDWFWVILILPSSSTPEQPDGFWAILIIPSSSHALTSTHPSFSPPPSGASGEQL